MPDAIRRFRQHPIYTTIGIVYATLLIGMSSLVWLGALGKLARGQSFRPNEWIALAAVSVLGGWYLNFMTVYHRLRRIDPETYALATRDMGYIAFVWSRRSGPTILHNALAGLDLGQYPATLRYHVRFTLVLNLILLWTFVAVALGLLVKALWTSIRIA